jgi:hypothetical protein
MKNKTTITSESSMYSFQSCILLCNIRYCTTSIDKHVKRKTRVERVDEPQSQAKSVMSLKHYKLLLVLAAMQVLGDHGLRLNWHSSSIIIFFSLSLHFVDTCEFSTRTFVGLEKIDLVIDWYSDSNRWIEGYDVTRHREKSFSVRSCRNSPWGWVSLQLNERDRSNDEIAMNLFLWRETHHLFDWQW